jgi:ribosomal protein L11 methyltransferase
MSFSKQPEPLARWHALDLVVSSEAREAVEYALMEAGALGTETTEATAITATAEPTNNSLRITGYFDQLPDRERVRRELAEAFRIYQLRSSSVSEMTVRAVADEDWLGEWKKSWQPVEVGERFIIAPPWAEISNAHNRSVIRIEPGMAFGTGTHETTRLCLVAIEKYFAGGSFLDVGTGTGILAIAAAKLFPGAKLEACDTDADAVTIARENARLNGVAERIVFRVGTVEAVTSSADAVCANLTADVILPLLPALLSVTCGHLILSGILDTQVEAVKIRLQECGVTSPTEIMQDGEWVALIV